MLEMRNPKVRGSSHRPRRIRLHVKRLSAPSDAPNGIATVLSFSEDADFSSIALATLGAGVGFTTGLGERTGAAALGVGAGFGAGALVFLAWATGFLFSVLSSLLKSE